MIRSSLFVPQTLLPRGRDVFVSTSVRQSGARLAPRRGGLIRLKSWALWLLCWQINEFVFLVGCHSQHDPHFLHVDPPASSLPPFCPPYSYHPTPSPTKTQPCKHLQSWKSLFVTCALDTLGDSAVHSKKVVRAVGGLKFKLIARLGLQLAR